MSVRDVEKYIKDLNKPEKLKKKTNESLLLAYSNLAEELKQVLGTKVSVVSKNEDEGSGKLEIEFYNHDDLDRIVELLKK